MKKFLKVFSSLCLVLVVGAAVLLSGCAKKFGVQVTASDGGSVTAKGKSLNYIGKTIEVEQGKNFTCHIMADSNHYIARVVLNGKDVDISSWDKDEESGYLIDHYYEIKDVQNDAKVSVHFGKRAGVLTFNFTSGDPVSFDVERCTEYTLPTLVQFYSNADRTKLATLVELRKQAVNIYVADGADRTAVVNALKAIFGEPK